MAAKRPAPRKKTTTRKKSTTRKKAPAKRKYEPKSSRKVEGAMHDMHEGKLASGRSGKRVTRRKQAIAIGLSEARADGVKVPPPKRKR